MIDSLDTLPFSPTSHSTGSAFSAWLARHQLSATTATQSSPLHDLLHAAHATSPAESSKLFSLPPNTGHCTIDACSMPGRRTSAA